ncbi:hypothetical protein [Pediococcus stilesii]|uniref:hypothetical protein n=1 Tax=Pediococcus stilesii TaxID=331679 RepID=UPI00148620A4|nr:hypothetical protein [Pediococcus stilesii]
MRTTVEPFLIFVTETELLVVVTYEYFSLVLLEVEVEGFTTGAFPFGSTLIVEWP